MDIEEVEEPERSIEDVWAYARYRLAGLWRSSAARLEVGLTVLALAALFGPAFASWWQRWTLPASPQGYAVFVIPLTLAWLWLNRLRLALPELDALDARFTERSVLRFLLEEEPEPPRRLRGPLALGCLLTLLTLWMGEPTFSCMAFVLLLVGIVAYRNGTQALRVAAFPLFFLTTMIPLPGLVFDAVFKKMQTLLLRIATNLMQSAGIPAEITPEANPIIVPSGSTSYPLFAAQVGTGFAEAGLFLLLTLWYLSLIQAPFRAKIGGFVCGVVWISLLLALRLLLLGWMAGMEDKDLLAAMAPLTRWLLPLVGAAGQLLILRGLKCRHYQKWVTV